MDWLNRLVCIAFLTVLISSLAFSTPVIEWTYTWNGADDDCGRAVLVSEDGGFLVAGHTLSNGSYYDLILLKIDANGNQEWERFFNLDISDAAYDIQQTSDGGYIVCGGTSDQIDNFQALLLKLDSDGNEEWHETYGGYWNEYANGVKQTPDGGYILTGISTAGGSWGVYIVKADSHGLQEWDALYTDGNSCSGEDVIVAEDGGYIIAGYQYTTTGTSADGWLIKLDSDGEEVWQYLYGNSLINTFSRIDYADGGGYILTGYTDMGGSDAYDAWVVKINTEGSMEWQYLYGTGSNDFGNDIQTTDDSGAVVAGSFDDHANLLKTDFDGTELWSIDLFTDGHSSGLGVDQINESEYVVTGCIHYGNEDDNLFLVKILDENGIVSPEENLLPHDLQVAISPNPFNGMTRIEYTLTSAEHVLLRVYNVLGQEILLLLDENMQPGIHSVAWRGMDRNGNHVPSGMYFLRMETGSQSLVQRMILLQ